MLVFAYWYDGGRPSGCPPPCCGFIASEVVEAFALGMAAVPCGVGAGAAEELTEEAEVVEAAVGVAVPLVLAAAVEDELVGGERLEVEAVACELTDWFDDRRVEPTSFRKRWFIEDMET